MSVSVDTGAGWITLWAVLGVWGSVFASLADVVTHLTGCPDGPEPIWHVRCHIRSQAPGRDRKWPCSVGMPRVGAGAFFRISGTALSALHSPNGSGVFVCCSLPRSSCRCLQHFLNPQIRRRRSWPNLHGIPRFQADLPLRTGILGAAPKEK